MTEIVDFAKAIGNVGIAGLIVYLIYKLVDKWAPQFLAAQQETSKAMITLASAVSDGQKEQRDMLIAVRVLAQEIGDVKALLKDLAAKEKA